MRISPEEREGFLARPVPLARTRVSGKARVNWLVMSVSCEEGQSYFDRSKDGVLCF